MSQPAIHNPSAANTIPAETVEQIRHALASPGDPAAGEWLLEFIRASGAYTDQRSLRLRALSMVWLALHVDVEAAWPYLMWFNQNEPVISDHLAELLTDALDDMDCHVPMAAWLADCRDERLATFFGDFRPQPSPARAPDVLGGLLADPRAPGAGVWLAAFCRAAADNPSPAMERWRLLAAAWYATLFDPAEGRAYLQPFCQGADRLADEANASLLEAAGQLGCAPELLRWIAACPDPAVKTMLADLIHPDLPALSRAALDRSPDAQRAGLEGVNHEARAADEVQTFRRLLGLLEEAGLAPGAGRVLDLGCSALAPQTLLLSSAGYRAVGVDLQIPPAWLPVDGLRRWFKRRKHVQAWGAATAPFYQALAQRFEGKLRWRNAKIQLADPNRLHFADGSFAAAISANYVQHNPDLPGLLAELARVLEAGGLLALEIRPVAADSPAGGGPAPAPGWSLARERPHPLAARLIRNPAPAEDYRRAIEQHFDIEQWQPAPAEGPPRILVLGRKRAPAR